MVALGVTLAIGGWLAQHHLVRERIAATEKEVSELLIGKPAPVLSGLEPLNTEPAVLEEAAVYRGYQVRSVPSTALIEGTNSWRVRKARAREIYVRIFIQRFLVCHRWFVLRLCLRVQHEDDTREVLF